MLNKFKRPITVLEIAQRALSYTFEIASNYEATCVGILLDGPVDETVKKLLDEKRTGISLLAPSPLSHGDLEKLARCEHFDVVIVHDLFPYFNVNFHRLTEALLNLGDYCFFDNPGCLLKQNLVERKIPCVFDNPGRKIFLKHRKKTSIDLARFTQNLPKGKLHYTIESSFTKKTFFKEGLAQPIPWIAGINLVTFALLKGIYPTDEQICSQVERMKPRCTNHNDLIIGNMILQGDRLIPIDMGDERRKADINLCISLALKFFEKGNTRLKNPEKWMQDYFHAILKK